MEKKNKNKIKNNASQFNVELNLAPVIIRITIDV